jgi:hypothetical protein
MASKDLWPTPRASPNENRQTKRTPSQEAGTHGLSLAAEVSHHARNWPTPTVQDAANNGGPSQHLRNSKPLNAEAGGALSPDWVEWLMGQPIGWTSLDPLPAADFAEWQRKIDAGEWWRDDPSLKRSSGELVPRTTPGVPNRAKRLRAIGNGQVPSCAVLAWRIISARSVEGHNEEQEETKCGI